ncbi:hypothetical protein D1007_45369 [Hordeum vulgare]|nr:hypothetical protein D1007_45369 [Hordeum vulgare]
MPPMAAGGAPMPPMREAKLMPPMAAIASEGAPKPSMPPMAAAGSTSELAGASVDAAPVRRPASFFFVFELPEPSTAFFLPDVFPFFDPTAAARDGTAAARDGASATPPVGMVIRGGEKRLRARPTVGGAPAVAAATLAVLGFSAAAGGGGGGLSAVQRGERGAGLRVHGGRGAGAGARCEGGRKRESSRARSSLPRAEVCAPNYQRGMRLWTARPTCFSARAVFARPLEHPAASRAR